jgi:hypothetical protein
LSGRSHDTSLCGSVTELSVTDGGPSFEHCAAM